jgi:two-component sensor histidine kinase
MSAGDKNQSNLAKFPLVTSDTPEATALIAIVRRLSVSRSVPEIMDIVAHSARALIGADGITFVLRDGDLCYYAEEDAIGPLWKGQRFPMSACISGWCMLQQRAAVIPDIFQDDRIPQDAYRPTFVRSLAMVPVRQDDPIAAVGAYWANPRKIQQGEVQLLQTIADAASLAVAYVDSLHQQDPLRRLAEALAEKDGERELLIGELVHRMRNMVALVQVVVKQTIPYDQEACEALARRIAAVLTTDEFMQDGIIFRSDLAELLTSQLAGYGRARFTLSGPATELALDQSRAVAFSIHELATNATKYGALSCPDGRVFVSWNLATAGLQITWQELGGPPVRTPTRAGFGSRFVQLLLAKKGGSIETEWLEAGVVHKISLPTH